MRQAQSVFAHHIALLILHIESKGYEVTLGEAWRSPEEADRLAATGQGIRRSLHCDRLAVDLNLFKDGVYLSRTEDHKQFGEWWIKQHELARWGGYIKTRVGSDGNHYSFANGGRA